MKTFLLSSTLTLLLFSLSMQAIAQNQSPIQEQILEALETDGVGDELKKSSEAQITFYLDSQGRIVLLDLDSKDVATEELIKESLQGILLETDRDDLAKTYKLAVTFNLLN